MSTPYSLLLQSTNHQSSQPVRVENGYIHQEPLSNVSEYGTHSKNLVQTKGWVIWKNTTTALFCGLFLCFILLELYFTQIGVHYSRIWQDQHRRLPDGSGNCTFHICEDKEEIRRSAPTVEQDRSGLSTDDSCTINRTKFDSLRVNRITGKDMYQLSDGWMDELSLKERVHISGQNITFHFKLDSSSSLRIDVENIHILPEYVDADYKHSDNHIVLDKSRRSNMHHWRAPLEEILRTQCRHPLPKHYFLTMHPYLDRHTTAVRQTCVDRTVLKFLNVTEHDIPVCPWNLPHGSSMFVRSINGQCTQNKASHLPAQRNSIYCTSNTPIVNDVFDEYIYEKQSYLKDAHCDSQRRVCQTCRQSACPLADVRAPTKRFGANWSERLLTTEGNHEHDCCAPECYTTPGCLEYYSPSCQSYTIDDPRTQEICLQGKTLKLTLNPEFEFINGSYMCHLKRTEAKILYSLNLRLSINSTISLETGRLNIMRESMIGERTRGMANVAQSQHKQSVGDVFVLGQGVMVQYDMTAGVMKEGIFRKEPRDGKFYFAELKKLNEFTDGKPEIFRHKQEKYTIIQFTRPFRYNTETWMNETCGLNISHIYSSQPLYKDTTAMQVKLRSPIRRLQDGSFWYAFTGSEEAASVTATVNRDGKNDWIEQIFCSKIPLKRKEHTSTQNWTFETGHINDNYPLRIKLERNYITEKTMECERQFEWRISISGWTVPFPTFVRLTIFKSERDARLKLTKTQRLASRHLLLSFKRGTRSHHTHKSSVPFSIYVDVTHTLGNPDKLQQPVYLQIYLQDCRKTHRLYANLHWRNISWDTKQQITIMSNESVIPKSRVINHMYAPFLIVCSLIGVSYFFLLLIYGATRVIIGRRRRPTVYSKISHFRIGQSPTSAGLPTSFKGKRVLPIPAVKTSRKLLIMLYLCFRIFYTFLFTISVGLSVILSIEYQVARQLSSLSQTHNIMQVNNVVPVSSMATPDHVERIVNPVQVDHTVFGAKYWIFEVARIEEFTNAELLRQVHSMEHQQTDCADQSTQSNQRLLGLIEETSEEYKVWLSPSVEKINLPTSLGWNQSRMNASNTWVVGSTLQQSATINHAAWTRLGRTHWSPFLDNVDQYLGQLRDQLDTQVIDQWSPFDRLIGNLLENLWIAPARQALNQTRSMHNRVTSTDTRPHYASLHSPEGERDRWEQQQQHSTNSATKRRLREAHGLKLSNFLGVPQPQHARLTGARLWNSFRSLVPGLPEKFHASIEDVLKSYPIPPRPRPTTHERRFVTTTNDWYHTTKGLNTPDQMDFSRVLPRRPFFAKRNRQSVPRGFFLTLTEIRLILLLLDAYIICTRCYQTYQYMHRVWFGRIDHVFLSTVESTDEVSEFRPSITLENNSVSHHPSTRGDRQLLSQSDSLKFVHPRNCNAIKMDLSDITSSDKNPASTYSPRHVTPSERITTPLLNTESDEHNYVLDGSTGRLTACYCCLNSHYLLVVIGIGLIILGLIIIWTVERHSRSGCPVTRSGLYTSANALEAYRLRTNVILKNLQPHFWNTEQLKSLQLEMNKNSMRVGRWIERIHREKIAMMEQYFNELCAIHKGGQNARRTDQLVSMAQTVDVPSQAEQSPCIMLGKDLRFHKTSLPTAEAQSVVNFPHCTFDPLLSSTLLQSSWKEIPYLVEGHPTSDTTSSTVNRPTLTSPEDVLFGNTSSLLTACQKLVLTSLSVVLTMGGFLACVHIIKLILRSINFVHIRKINLITAYPINAQPTRESKMTTLKNELNAIENHAPVNLATVECNYAAH